MAPAQRHDVGDGVLEVRADLHLRHRHRNVLQRRIAQVAALKNVRQRMAQLLAYPQLSLARRVVSLVLAFHDWLPRFRSSTASLPRVPARRCFAGSPTMRIWSAWYLTSTARLRSTSRRQSVRSLCD